VRDELLASRPRHCVGGLGEFRAGWGTCSKPSRRASFAVWPAPSAAPRADREIRSGSASRSLRDPPLVEEHRANRALRRDQINDWQEKKLVDELERNIGADLQYIRVNGTLVGGLAGLAIAALTQLAR
jgi:hypothetical protein